MMKGRSLQLGSIHHYRENFSRPFDIKYEDIDGSTKYVHQTTYGMSERLLGAVVGVHGDDKGLVLPPAIAPFQVVIVPILAKGNLEEVTAQARALRDELKAAGIRVTLDESDERPGSKFFKWEIKGVPLRLELGARDIEKGVVAFARRNDGQKGPFTRAAAADEVKASLAQIAQDMRAKATEFMKSNIITVESLDSVPEKMLRFGWCGDEECGKRIEEKSELKILGSPYAKEEFHGKCIGCGKDTDMVVYAARAM
jgi:prolyl-tRNA synthetase